jgi:predicted 3-demethylubiquinone-9 3-methyltransferase (glyoxalase superfamily)
MEKIKPFLWFDSEAEEAANHSITIGADKEKR